MAERRHVVIVGAGFAGLNAARALARDDSLHITLIDKRNHHLFQPLLYQVSMAELSAADIAAPIRGLFRRKENVEVIMAEVTDVMPNERKVRTSFGDFSYDWLVLAPGSSHSYFGNNHWERYAPGLKTLSQATEIRHRVLLAFEHAENCAHTAQRRRLLTFVIVGGGPTGVELAGAIGELAHLVLPRDFKRVDPAEAKIVLVEGGDRVLAGFDEKLVERAVHDLRALGVEVRTQNMVSEINEHGVKAGDEWIEAATVLWAAGVSPSPLGKALGVPQDRTGRVIVHDDLSVPGHPEIFVAGDLARFEQDGAPVPGVAAVALQQGRYIGKAIRAEAAGGSRGRFRYRDRGSMALIGHSRAIAQIWKLRLTGRIAWLAWAFLHIYYLSGFRNRLFVMLQWAWAYFTHKRSSRIIVERQWRIYPDESGEKR